ncbi:MAG: hypothetical protein AABX74_04260, partial [Nanoarchaeota archaeon]
VVVQVTDEGGNSDKANVTFNVQSGTVPGLQFTLRGENLVGVVGQTAQNRTNITSRVGLNLSGANGAAAAIDRISYFSSCDSTVRVEKNGTVVYPFNASSCNVQSANRTLTVTINDTAGNSNTTVLGFLVDNLGPSLIVTSPTDGETFTNARMSINFTVQDNGTSVSSYGFYLDGNDAEHRTILNKTDGGNLSAGGATTSDKRSVNLTGTHTIKVFVNDSLGNVVNSSVITFTQIGAVDILLANRTIYTNPGFDGNITNVSFFNESGSLIIQTGIQIDQTLRLYLEMNDTAFGSIGRAANVTIDFNGSAANWNKTNHIYIWMNESKTAMHIINNYTATVLTTVFANNSFTSFLPDNSSYFVKVRMALSASNNATLLGGVNRSQLLYFPDEANFKLAPSTINVTQCAFDFSPAHSTTSGLPCWNTTNNLSIDVFLPHFSVLALVNDTVAPRVNVTNPTGTQEVSGFVPNITVSSDAVSCGYKLNITAANLTTATSNVSSVATPSNNLCTWSEVLFKNGTYNIIFNASDANGNVNVTDTVNERVFRVADGTKPITPNATRVSISVSSTTAATVTIGVINESVNA